MEKGAAIGCISSDAIEWAKTLQQEFSYPVDTIVLSSNGEPLSQISIEEMFQTSRSGKIGRSYRDMLQEALNASDQ